MRVEAGVRQLWGLNFYGEFDSFEEAKAHLEAEGWELTKVVHLADITRWEFERGAEVMDVREVA